MSIGYTEYIGRTNKKASARLIGVKLGRLCIKHGHPVTKVSSTIGVSRQTVYNWFCGIYEPRNNNLLLVKKYIDELENQK